MSMFILKTLVASLVISFCSWLSNKFPTLAGFIVSLPLTTILVLLFSQYEFSEPEKSVHFAKSIFVGVPISLSFFVPFFLSQRFELTFGESFLSGIVLLIIGYFIHKSVVDVIL